MAFLFTVQDYTHWKLYFRRAIASIKDGNNQYTKMLNLYVLGSQTVRIPLSTPRMHAAATSVFFSAFCRDSRTSPLSTAEDLKFPSTVDGITVVNLICACSIESA